MAKDVLRFGDATAFLSSENPVGYLCGDGFLEGSTTLLPIEDKNGVPQNFRDCIFEIAPKNQYTAQKVLSKHLENPPKSQSKRDADLLRQYKDLAEKEKGFNLLESRRLQGGSVVYGNIVQLLHSRSRKYISVRPMQSDSEKDALSVGLDSGSESSWFKIMPRFKVRAEGDKVYIEDQILLESVKHKVYLHIAVHSSVVSNVNDLRHEVNASTNRTVWKLTRYSSYNASADQFIKSGDVVRFVHTELECNLVCQIKREDLVNKRPGEVPRCDAVLKVDDKASKKLGANQKRDAYSLFEIELETSRKGGVCTWSRTVRFRHLITGYYLAMVPAPKPAKPPLEVAAASAAKPAPAESSKAEAGASVPKAEGEAAAPAAPLLAPATLTASDDGQYDAGEPLMNLVAVTRNPRQPAAAFPGPETLFTLMPTSTPDSPNVPRKSIVRLVHSSGAWVCYRPAAVPAGAKSKDLPLVGSSNGSDEDAFLIRHVPLDEVDDLNFLLGVIPTLQGVVPQLRELRPEDAKLGVQKIDFDFVNGVLEDLVFFTTKTNEKNPLVAIGIPFKKRQKLLRKLQVADIFIDMLRAPFTNDKCGGKFCTFNELSKHPALAKMCRLGYRMLFHFHNKNEKNELYLAKKDWFDLFQAQLQSTFNFGVAEVVSNLLDANEDLLDEFVSDHEVLGFVQLVEQRRETKYLHLLTSLVSVGVKPIVSNQELILDQLLTEQFSSVLVKLKCRAVDAGTGSTRGLARMPSVSEEYYIEYLDKSRKPTELPLEKLGPNTPFDMLNYYHEQLMLLQKLCLGRNARAKSFVEYTLGYTRKTVMDVLKNEKVHLMIRTQFCRLLLNLFIDNDRQEEGPTFALTRVWDLIKETDENGDLIKMSALKPTQLATTDDDLIDGLELAKEFTDIKAYMQFYFETSETRADISQVDRNRLTLAMATCVNWMIRFGLYTWGELYNLFPPMIRLLDGRNDLVPHSASGDDDAGMLERYKVTELSNIVMKSKQEMLNCLLVAGEFRRDVRLTKSLIQFKMSLANLDDVRGRTPNFNLDELDLGTFEQLFQTGDEMGKIFDFDHQGAKILVPVLIDLINYEHPGLVLAALRVLMQHFKQRESVMELLSKVQVLTDAGLIQTYRLLPKQQQSLRLYLTKNVLALRDKSDPNNPFQRKVSEIMQGFIGTCRGSGSGSQLENQRLLRNLEVHETVLELARLPRLAPSLRSECTQFFILFVEGNSDNQQAMFAYVDTLIEVLNGDPDLELLLLKILEDNDDVLQKVKDSLANYFSGLILKNGPKIKYIKPLSAMLSVLGKRIEKNQILVAHVLRDLHSRQRLYVFDNPDEKVMSAADLVPYRVELLKLCLRCCEGSRAGSSTSVALLCSAFLPLSQLAAALDRRHPPAIKSLYLQLLTTVHLEAVAPYSPVLARSPDLWLILASVPKLLKECEGLNVALDADFAEYFDSLCNLLREFFKHQFVENEVSADKAEVVKLIVQQLMLMYTRPNYEPQHKTTMANVLAVLEREAPEAYTEGGGLPDVGKALDDMAADLHVDAGSVDGGGGGGGDEESGEGWNLFKGIARVARRKKKPAAMAITKTTKQLEFSKLHKWRLGNVAGMFNLLGDDKRTASSRIASLLKEYYVQLNEIVASLIESEYNVLLHVLAKPERLNLLEGSIKTADVPLQTSPSTAMVPLLELSRDESLVNAPDAAMAEHKGGGVYNIERLLHRMMKLVRDTMKRDSHFQAQMVDLFERMLEIDEQDPYPVPMDEGPNMWKELIERDRLKQKEEEQAEKRRQKEMAALGLADKPSVHLDDAEGSRDAELALQRLFSEAGGSPLVIDLISSPLTPPELLMETMEFAMELLEGGDASIQEHMYAYLMEEPDGNFFQRLKDIIQNTMIDIMLQRKERKAARTAAPRVSGQAGSVARPKTAASRMTKLLNDAMSPLRPTSNQVRPLSNSNTPGRSNATPGRSNLTSGRPATNNSGVDALKELDDSERKEEELIINTLTLVQLLCEGHNQKMQMLLADQRNSARSINLLSAIADLLLLIIGTSKAKLDSKLDEHNIRIAQECFDALIESIQGPCVENQKVLLATKLPELCVMLCMSDPAIGSQISTEEEVQEVCKSVLKLKRSAALLISSLLEGATKSSAATERITLLITTSSLISYLQKRLRSDKSREIFPNERLASTMNLALPEYETVRDLYLLAMMLSQFEPQRTKILTRTYKEDRMTQLKRTVGVVEIIRQADPDAQESEESEEGSSQAPPGESLERLFFPIPEICSYLPKNAIEDFDLSVNRDTPKDKLEGLLDEADNLYVTMLWNRTLKRNNVIRPVLWANERFLRQCSLALVFVINVLLIASLVQPSWDAEVYGYEFHWWWFEPWLRALGILQAVLSGISMLATVVQQVPVLFLKSLIFQMTAGDKSNPELVYDILYVRAREKEKDNRQQTPPNLSNVQESVFFIIKEFLFEKQIPFLRKCRALGAAFADWYIIHAVAYCVASIAGIFNPLCYSYCLLEFVARFDRLQNVIRAVTQSGVQLLLTAVLGLIIIYYFAIVNFLFFAQGFEVREEVPGDRTACYTLISCFVQQLTVGMVYGGSVLDILAATPVTGNIYIRILFDVLFNFIVIILLLNIVFGLILDTFAALREARAAKDENRLNFCFVCSLQRDQLERCEGGFDFHTEVEHNMKSYMYFLIYLKLKDPLEFSGSEQVVFRLIQERSIAFFPMLQSMTLNEIGAAEKDQMEVILEKLSKLEKLDELFSMLQKIRWELSPEQQAIRWMPPSCWLAGKCRSDFLCFAVWPPV